MTCPLPPCFSHEAHSTVNPCAACAGARQLPCIVDGEPVCNDFSGGRRAAPNARGVCVPCGDSGRPRCLSAPPRSQVSWFRAIIDDLLFHVKLRNAHARVSISFFSRFLLDGGSIPLSVSLPFSCNVDSVECNVRPPCEIVSVHDQVVITGVGRVAPPGTHIGSSLNGRG